jgi:hypothetical protein
MYYCTDVNVIAAILADATASNNFTVFSQGGSTGTLEYIIPIFLAMVSSKTKIPHTMILLGFGISISLLGLAGFDLVNSNQFIPCISDWMARWH